MRAGALAVLLAVAAVDAVRLTPGLGHALSRRTALAAGAASLFAATPAAKSEDAVAVASAVEAAAKQPGFFRFANSQAVWTAENAVGVGASQKTYSPKFLAYLARLLLNFDRATQSWWQDQNPNAPFVSPRQLERNPELLAKQSDDFQRLQASVSFGLRGFQNGDGVERLFSLLQSTFGGTEAGDRQLALLFSLMGEGQPTARIAELVGSTDNAAVKEFVVTDTGSGYDPRQPPPLVSVTAGPASSDAATGEAVLGPTGRVLQVSIESGGKGYLEPPVVVVAPPAKPPKGSQRRRARCQAVLRDGTVVGLVLIDAGEGYTAVDEPLRIEVSAPGEDWSARDAAPDEAWEGDNEAEQPSRRERRRLGGSFGEAPGLRRSDTEFGYRSYVGNPRYTTRAESGEPSPPPNRQRAVLRGLLDYGVVSVRVLTRGDGYGLDLPAPMAIAPPPDAASAALNTTRTASAYPVLQSAASARRLSSWLPATSRTFAFTDLLPSTLVPQKDACLGRFTVSPVQKQEKNWCVYFEDEWALVKETKLSTYFNPLDVSGQISPIERERELPASVFARFALGGALCNCISEGAMLPIYASKVRAQAEPSFPEGVEGVRTMLSEGGPRVLWRSLDTTLVGYSLYGGLSFGCTELFERVFKQALGPSIAATYPVPILLGASSVASILAAVAYSPFEALRIRIISAGADPGVVKSLQNAMDSEEGPEQLFAATLPLTLIEIPYAAARFVVFDLASRVLTDALPPLDDTGALAVSLVAGALAGIAASLLTHPLDTVVVRVCEGGESGEGGAVEGGAVEGGAAEGGAAVAAAEAASVAMSADAPEVLRDGSGVDDAMSLDVLLADDESTDELCYIADEPRGIAGFFNTLMAIAQEEGIGALYSGATTRALYIAALSAIQFFLYEGLKQLLHVARPDLELFLDILSGLELTRAGT